MLKYGCSYDHGSDFCSYCGAPEYIEELEEVLGPNKFHPIEDEL